MTFGSLGGASGAFVSSVVRSCRGRVCLNRGALVQDQRALDSILSRCSIAARASAPPSLPRQARLGRQRRRRLWGCPPALPFAR